MVDFDSPEVIRKVKIRDSFAGDARDHFGARFSGAGHLISTPTKDPFLLRASHNVQAPHNYNPVHEHNTRYREWYSTHFAVVTEEFRKPKGQRVGPTASDENRKCFWLALLILLLAIWFGWFSAATPGDQGTGLLARGDDVNETAVSELQRLFDELEKEHEKTKGELDSLSARLQEDPHSSQVQLLRQELAQLSQRLQASLDEQSTLMESQGQLSVELNKLHKQSETTMPNSAERDGLQDQLDQMKSEWKELEASIKAAKDQNKRAEENTLASNGVSKDVKAAVSKSIDGLLSEHKLFQECSAAVEGCSPGFKQQVVEEVQKSVLSDMAQSSDELVDKYVQKSVWEAIAGYDSEGKKSELEGSIKSVLRTVYEEGLGGVDWMLSINGADIVSNSPSFDPCQDETGVRAYVCRGELYVNKPIQLSPETIIKTDATQGGSLGEQWTQLGHCWAMNGTEGFVEVRLDRPVEPTKFVLEHAPSKLSFHGGASAPRRFRVQGWLSGDLEEQRETLVEGEYQIAREGYNAHIQSFPIISKDETPMRQIDRVRLEVLSNHGNPSFTCLYHLRLYAKLPPLPMVV